MRAGGMYLEREPIVCEEGVCTWSGSQSCERRGYVPGVGANHVRGGGIYLELHELLDDFAGLVQLSQSHERRGYIPGV